MEFSSMVILMRPPTGFEVKDFLEGVREHWIFELKDDGGLSIDVYLTEMNLEDQDE